MSNIVEFVKQQEQLFCGALTEQTVTWAKESHHQCCGDRHHLKPGQQTGLSGSSRRHGVP